MDQANIPAAPVRRLEDLPADAYLRDTLFFHRAGHPTEGPVTLPGPAAGFSATPASARHLPPRLGAHTEEGPRGAGPSAEESAATVQD